MRLLAALVVLLALSGVAFADDGALRRVVDAQYRATVEASHVAAGGRGGPDAVQAQYNAARDLQEALSAAEPVSTSCRPLLRSLRRFASAELLQVEGFDRPWPPLTTQGMLQEARAAGDVTRDRGRCRPGRATAFTRIRELTAPLSGEAFFGDIRDDRAPPGAARARIGVGSWSTVVPVTNRRLQVRVAATVRTGRHDIKISYLPARGETVVGRVEARSVWLLPRSARRAAAETTSNGALTARLVSAARNFNGYSGIWVHDLSTGRTAGWNSDARFAAASTVKLGIYVAAIERFGARPERSAVAYDLKALAGWSSNAAANRLLVEVGGSEGEGSSIAEQTLRRLGATSSTYTGNYRLGTGRRKIVDVTNPPPIISSRVTTAHDLARILFQLHAGALGNVRALQALRLTRHQARVGLALLLAWQAPAPGDNLGLFRPALGSSISLAQKNGWFSSVRHTAAIVYTTSGPKIVVVLTYRPGLTLREAQALGARVLREARIG